VEEILRRLHRHLDAQGYAHGSIVSRVRMIKALGVHPADATFDDVYRVLDAAKTAGTRRTYFVCLRLAYQDLILLGLVETDPTVGVRVLPVPQGTPHPVPQPVVDHLVASLPEAARAWTILGAYAGLRSHEVVQVQRDHLLETVQGMVLHVPNGKGGKSATIPAHPLVVDALQYHRPGQVLWPMRASNMSPRWRLAAERVGVTGYRFHSLRHSFGTNTYALSRDLLLVRDLMRHSSTKTK
jgi:integrase